MFNFIPLQQAAAGAESGGMGGLIMIVALFVVMWFFMIRPQQKRQKEIKKQREALTKGDKVVTAGGIFGVITDIKEKYFVVEVTKGVSLSIDKGSIYPANDDSAKELKDSAK